MSKTEVKLDERFKFGPAPIQTAEDATMAFLREEISEEEFREACGKFGVVPGTLFNTPASNRPDRVDAAFHRDIPDDIFLDTLPPELDVEARLKEVEAKSKLREEATKKVAEKEDDQNKVVVVPIEGPNLTADEVHELEEKHLTPNKVAVTKSEEAEKAEKSDKKV